MSFNMYDKLRKSETLGKRSADSVITNTPKRKRHGIENEENISFNTDNLLEEAHTWSNDQRINWSELARKYGLVQTNGGHT